jgi:hypothetical protein
MEVESGPIVGWFSQRATEKYSGARVGLAFSKHSRYTTPHLRLTNQRSNYSWPHNMHHSSVCKFRTRIPKYCTLDALRPHPEHGS